jgi:hypothetical protein
MTIIEKAKDLHGLNTDFYMGENVGNRKDVPNQQSQLLIGGLFYPQGGSCCNG